MRISEEANNAFLPITDHLYILIVFAIFRTKLKETHREEFIDSAISLPDLELNEFIMNYRIDL